MAPVLSKPAKYSHAETAERCSAANDILEDTLTALRVDLMDAVTSVPVTGRRADIAERLTLANEILNDTSDGQACGTDQAVEIASEKAVKKAVANAISQAMSHFLSSEEIFAGATLAFSDAVSENRNIEAACASVADSLNRAISTVVCQAVHQELPQAYTAEMAKFNSSPTIANAILESLSEFLSDATTCSEAGVKSNAGSCVDVAATSGPSGLVEADDLHGALGQTNGKGGTRVAIEDKAHCHHEDIDKSNTDKSNTNHADEFAPETLCSPPVLLPPMARKRKREEDPQKQVEVISPSGQRIVNLSVKRVVYEERKEKLVPGVTLPTDRGPSRQKTAVSAHDGLVDAEVEAAGTLVSLSRGNGAGESITVPTEVFDNIGGMHDKFTATSPQKSHNNGSVSQTDTAATEDMASPDKEKAADMANIATVPEVDKTGTPACTGSSGGSSTDIAANETTLLADTEVEVQGDTAPVPLPGPSTASLRQRISLNVANDMMKEAEASCGAFLEATLSVRNEVATLMYGQRLASTSSRPVPRVSVAKMEPVVTALDASLDAATVSIDDVVRYVRFELKELHVNFDFGSHPDARDLRWRTRNVLTAKTGAEKRLRESLEDLKDWNGLEEEARKMVGSMLVRADQVSADKRLGISCLPTEVESVVALMRRRTSSGGTRCNA
ncbi:hypothetical protein NKR19_g5331 [Coniochaeta hoffmannii]|uniref:Uncharacterized protein n=1 Tax=Coniochaeta hoffmannii TaxID=91930 RepID=A0AA38RKY2_9PEZI|nr:hypothetical protein NKR19_g5331 [Coniochaeta hoffmannii]